MNNDKVLRDAIAEMKQLKEEHGFVRLDLSLEVLLAVIGALQLAMRHSGFKQRPSYGVVAKFIEDIRGHLDRYPAVKELLRRGGMEEYDEEFDG